MNSPQNRVRWLLRFNFSHRMRGHTIAQLLKDPETADWVPNVVRGEAADWHYQPAKGRSVPELIQTP